MSLTPEQQALESARIESIINGTSADFSISDNPAADPKWHEGWAINSIGIGRVAIHDSIIESQALNIGINADWLRAIMYLETSQGMIRDVLGAYKELITGEELTSIQPMNINPGLWDGIGGLTAEQISSNLESNIQAGALVLKGIYDNLAPGDKTFENVASIWNGTFNTTVTDFGARAQNILDNRLWEDPSGYEYRGFFDEPENANFVLDSVENVKSVLGKFTDLGVEAFKGTLVNTGNLTSALESLIPGINLTDGDNYRYPTWLQTADSFVSEIGDYFTGAFSGFDVGDLPDFLKDIYNSFDSSDGTAYLSLGVWDVIPLTDDFGTTDWGDLEFDEFLLTSFGEVQYDSTQYPTPQYKIYKENLTETLVGNGGVVGDAIYGSDHGSGRYITAIKHGETVTIDAESYFLTEIADSVLTASDTITSFIASQVDNAVEWFTAPSGANIAFANWLGANLQDLVDGNLSAEDAFIDLAEYLGSQYIGHQITGALSSLEAAGLLQQTLVDGFGLNTTDAAALSNNISIALGRFAIELATESDGWTSTDYLNAGISITTSVVTQHYATKIFGTSITWADGTTTTYGQAPIAGTVAAASTIVTALLNDPNLNTSEWIQLGAQAGLAGAVAVTSTQISNIVAGAAGGPVGIIAGAVLGLVGSKILGGIFGGATFREGEFPSRAALLQSVYQVVEIDDGSGNMVDALVAVDQNGSTIIMQQGITHTIGGSRKPVEGRNPNFILIRDFLKSAARCMRRTGHVLVTAVASPHYQGAFQFDEAAEAAGFAPPGILPFSISTFPGYSHTNTNDGDSALTGRRNFRTWVFSLKDGR